MDGQTVNSLISPEARVAEDDDKSLAYLRVKLNVFSVAFHKIEEASLPPPDQIDQRFGWVPFPVGAFADLVIEGFFLSGQDRTKKFLDIGCGIGTKLLLASVLFDAHGFEIDPETLALARKLGCKQAFAADAFEFARYGEFDLVYFYRPFRDESLQRKFEVRLVEQLRPGQLVAPMHPVCNWDEDPVGVRWPVAVEKVGRFWYRVTAPSPWH